MTQFFSLYEKEFKPPPHHEIDQGVRAFVTFSLEEEWYAIDVEQVRIVSRFESITPLPNLPRSILGVINLRGTLISVINLKNCLGLFDSELKDKSRIVIVEKDAISVGLLVDSSTEILTIPFSKIEPLIPTLTEQESDLLEGQIKSEGRLIGILNVQKVMNRALSEGGKST